jgi:hypothetical protein
MSATEIHSGIFRNWDLNIYESTQSFPQDGNLERKTIMNPNEPNDIDNDHFLTPGELVKKYGPRAYQNVVPANKEKHRDIFECKACGCRHQIQSLPLCNHQKLFRVYSLRQSDFPWVQVHLSKESGLPLQPEEYLHLSVRILVLIFSERKTNYKISDSTCQCPCRVEAVVSLIDFKKLATQAILDSKDKFEDDRYWRCLVLSFSDSKFNELYEACDGDEALFIETLRDADI